MTTQQLWHTNAQTELREVPFSLHESSLTVKARYSMISQGTEKLVSKAGVPTALQESMKVPYMLGSFQLPIHYGYAMVGEVISGPETWVGKDIHCMHPHASTFQVKPDSVIELSPSLGPEKALIGNIETAINAIWDSRIKDRDKVLISGLGSIGTLVGALAQKLYDISIYFIEPIERRSAWAKAEGWKPYDNRSVDIAFHTTGSSTGLQTAIEAIGMEGKVIELSWYGNREVNLRLGGTFHTMRKQIISSQVSTIPGHMKAEWDYAKRRKWAAELSIELSLPNPELISLAKAADWFNGDWQTEAAFILIDYSL